MVPPDDDSDGNSFSAKSIIIPDSVTNIDEGWFAGCKGLTNIKVDQNNAAFCDIDGVLFSKDKTKLVYYPNGRNIASYTIPKGTTDIADMAFIICESLTDIIIPDSVCYIGTSAFYGCCSMKRITIPNSVNYIGQLAIMDKTIECHRGSVAEEYSKKYNNLCKIID